MSSGHAVGHVTNTEKMQRLPGKLLYRDFFHGFNVLNLILITLCIDFVSFLQCQILREFQNTEKMQRLPGKLLYWEFFHSVNIFI